MSNTIGSIALQQQSSGFINVNGLTGSQSFDFLKPFDIASGFDVAYSQDGKYFIGLTSAVGDKVFLFDTTTSPWSRIGAVSLVGNGLRCCFSEDNSFLAITHDAGLDVYNVGSWTIALSIADSITTKRSCDFSGDGLHFAYLHTSANAGDNIFLYDTATFTQQIIAMDGTTTSTQLKSLSLNHDGGFMAVTSSNAASRLVIYNTSTFAKNVISPPSVIEHCQYNNSGDKLGVVGTNTIGYYLIAGFVQHIDSSLRKYDGTAYNSTDLAWLNNDKFYACGNTASPAVVEFNTNGDVLSTPELTNSTYDAEYISVVPELSQYEINGTIDESLAATDFECVAYDYATDVIVGKTTTSSSSFTIPVLSNTPTRVVVQSNKPALWRLNTVYSIGQLIFPTNPETTPYYYKAANSGSTGATEPIWTVTAGSNVVDGGITWDIVERLVQPVSHSPIIPTLA
jgi:hypothetical protein